MLTMLVGSGAMSQSSYKVTYQQLKVYEGTYEFGDHSTLEIAASPKDTLLYAIIGTARYKLRPLMKDVFYNNGNQAVQFVWDGKKIAGYKVADDHPDILYKLVSKKVTFSDKIWFARDTGGKPFTYHYNVPADLRDGLETGSIINSGLDTALIRTLMNRIVDGTYQNVHSVLLLKNGKLVLEEYFYEYDVKKLHEQRSATKSFVSALTGIAVAQGLIKSADDKVLSYFPEYQPANMDERKRSLALQNLLTQRSGFACNDHDSKSPGNETKVYATDDWIRYMLDLPMIDDPGSNGSYCSGNVILLNRIVEKASQRSLYDFARDNLFSKIGVRNFKWEFVPGKSHAEGFAQLYLRPRDMAKFGLLYLNGGQWKGQQVIAKEWVEQSLTKHSVVDGIDYGYLWWCEPLTANGVTYNGVAAKGNGGQRIFLWPALNMLAVVTAGNYNTQSPSNKLLIECILAGVKK